MDWERVVQVQEKRRIYDKGFDDAVEGRKRRLVVLKGFLNSSEEAKELYNQGYDDGLLHRLGRN